MQIHFLEWDEQNIEHIAGHQVSPDEVEQACKSRPLIFRGPRGRHFIFGRTAVGRYLFMVIRYRGKGLAYPITARDMEPVEKRLYQEHR